MITNESREAMRSVPMPHQPMMTTFTHSHELTNAFAAHNRDTSLTDFVEIEGEIAGKGAVETGFEKGSPTMLPAVRSTLVLLANAAHARVHPLYKRLGDHLMSCLLKPMKNKKKKSKVMGNGNGFLTLPQLMYSTAVSRKKK